MPERLIPGHESASEVSQSVPRGSELQRALAEAREPGFHFTAQEENTQASAEVQRAVQAATRGLASMVGVASIQAGHDARGRPVVQVKAQKGFDAAAFAQLPEAFEGVRTLLALDYDLLPLKRKRG